MSPPGRQGPRGSPFVAHNEFTEVQNSQVA